MQFNDEYFMGEVLKEAEKAARKKCWPIAGINRVVTGVNLDQSGALNIKPLLSDFYQKIKFCFTVTKGILAEECAAIFDEN